MTLRCLLTGHTYRWHPVAGTDSRGFFYTRRCVRCRHEDPRSVRSTRALTMLELDAYGVGGEIGETRIIG